MEMEGIKIRLGQRMTVHISTNTLNTRDNGHTDLFIIEENLGEPNERISWLSISELENLIDYYNEYKLTNLLEKD